MKHLSDFYNQYPLNKTLRFGLVPVGKTAEFIKRALILENDERLAVEYKKTKKIIDRFHRDFIANVLSTPLLRVSSIGNQDSLEEFIDCYNNDNSDKRDDNLEKLLSNLREQIVAGFNKSPKFRHLDKKELIKEYLPAFLKDENEKAIVARFNDFTTYFTGFNQNRKNMYSSEAKSTAISYRLINQNLLKYADNCKIIERVISSLDDKVFVQLEKDFEPYLNTPSVLDFFKIENYNEILTQSQIEIYNAIIGGRVAEGEKVEIKGLNQYINEYNQTHDKQSRIPKLKPLFNQILSEKVGISFRLEQFEKPEQVIEEIKGAYNVIKNEILEELKATISAIQSMNLNGIFIAYNSDLFDICQRHYGAYDILTKALVAEFDQQTPRKKNQTQEMRDDQVKKYLKKIKSISLGKIDVLLKQQSGKSIVDYFLTMGTIDNEHMQRENLFALIENRYNTISNILDCPTPSEELLRKNITGIKDLLDAIKDLQRFIKPLNGTGEELDKEELFYSDFSNAYNRLDEIITPLYNKTRSYLTRKPFSTEKFKLNFETPTLLNSWPNYQAYSCAIFIENDTNYFLAILDKNNRSCLNSITTPNEESDKIGLVKHLQGGNMGNNVQNLMRIDGVVKKVNGRVEKEGPFAGQNLRLEQSKEKYLPQDINRIRIDKSYSIHSPKFKRDHLNKFIDFYKPLVAEYYSDYSFVFKETSEYKDFGDFTNDINQQAYQLLVLSYSKKYLNKLVNNGKVFLFKITSKDFSPFSKGKPNLHTIYWRMLFDNRNLKNVVYKLSGGAEMFFRKKSITNPVVHNANIELNNKSEYNIEHKPKSQFSYDIVKDRRYTRDHYEFHVPITMNFRPTGKGKLNREVLDFIKHNGIRHIIGIDRGERHLLYLTMIDMEGHIVEQFSLNNVASNPVNPEYKQDYNSLLASKEGDRQSARRNWTTIENIKELKQGYLSQIVHVISKMMVDNDAIVVLENLNTGFMRGRQKVEKSVYQKFEKMLIDKLNYIVDKDADVDAPTGALKALQLTEPYEKFNSRQRGNVRQCGFLFYIPAWNTSKIDPATGFVNLFDLRLSTMSEIKSFFSKFDLIRYNASKDVFEFSFDYNKFTTRAEGTRTRWSITTFGERIFTHRNRDKFNQFVSDIVNPTQMLKDIFINAGIDYTGNLKEGITSFASLDALKQLLNAFKLIMQMRNSETQTEVDYLISPALDNNGSNFDSRYAGSSMPSNADANGAYNIARKGLMIVEQIKKAESLDGLKYKVSNKDWLNFAQQ